MTKDPAVIMLKNVDWELKSELLLCNWDVWLQCLTHFSLTFYYFYMIVYSNVVHKQISLKMKNQSTEMKFGTFRVIDIGQTVNMI